MTPTLALAARLAAMPRADLEDLEEALLEYSTRLSVEAPSSAAFVAAVGYAGMVQRLLGGATPSRAAEPVLDAMAALMLPGWERKLRS